MKLPVKTGSRPARRIAAAAVLTALSAGTASSAEWTLQNGWTVNLDSTISFGMIARTSSPDCRNLGNDNGGCVGAAPTPLQLSNPAVFAANLDTLRLNQDLGDLRYGKGQVVSANLQYNADLYVKGSGGWSGLLRGVVNHDFAVDRSTRAPLDKAARDFAVSNPRWLDAYITKEFELGEQQARMRVGNQVLSWGEDLFITGGLNSINAIYLPAAHQPGTPLKNLFIPAPMVSFSSSLGDGFGIEAFYQWKWNRFTFDAPGTFFSTSNFVGSGGRGIYLPTSALNAAVGPYGMGPFPAGTIGNPATLNTGLSPLTGMPYGRRLSAAELADPAVNPAGPILASGTVIPRVGERTPHGGQGGVALRHHFAGSGDEMGLYYIRYDDKVPFVNYRVTGSSANPFGLEAGLDYGTHRDLFGLSYNLQAGEWVIGSELSFRPHDGVAIDPTAVIDPRNKYYCNALADYNAAPLGSECRGWLDTQHYQLHLTGIHILSPSGMLGGLLRASGASEGTITAETALAYYPKLRLDGTVPYAVSADYSLPTKTSWGMVLAASLTYPNIFGTRASLTPDIAMSQGLSGIAATSQPGFIKGAGAAVLGMTIDLKVKPGTKLRVDYTRNWGGGAANPLRDRNYASFSMASSF